MLRPNADVVVRFWKRLGGSKSRMFSTINYRHVNDVGNYSTDLVSPSQWWARSGTNLIYGLGGSKSMMVGTNRLPSTLKDWAPDCQKGAECPASDNSEKSIRSFGDWKANSPKIPSMFLLWVNLGKLACIWLTWCEAVQHANAIAMPSLYLQG